MSHSIEIRLKPTFQNDISKVQRLCDAGLQLFLIPGLGHETVNMRLVDGADQGIYVSLPA
jgi:hypothetical protein